MLDNDIFLERTQQERTIQTLSAERSFFAILCIVLFIWGVFFAHSDQIKERNQTISDLKEQLAESQNDLEQLQYKYEDLLTAYSSSGDLLVEKRQAAAYIADAASFLYDAVRIVPLDSSGGALVYHRYGCPQLDTAETVLIMSPAACKSSGLQSCPDCSATNSEPARTFQKNLEIIQNLTQDQSTQDYIQSRLN